MFLAAEKGTCDGLSAPAPVNNPDGARTRDGESVGDVNGEDRAELFTGATGENRTAGGWAFPNPVDAPTATDSGSFGAGTLGTVRSGSGSGLGSAFAP
ncbi:hypothetical protein A4E84_13585 [Streptomyces qaidamensis]|uniref:Uncharacterized protein n=1 Tax=Streptomyces qaidamensis TaxID=1783515 RepID=A0A143C077_9ACTN|nr:hypothetical protein A4E84_13585 [Streptomyces qaidamensis]